MVKKVAATVCLLVVAVLVWPHLFSNDKKQITALIQSACDLATFEETETKSIERMAWASDLASICRDPCGVTIHFEDDEPFHAKMSAKEVSKRLLFSRQHVSQLATKFSVDKVVVTGKNATVTGNVRAMGRSPGRDDYFLEQHPLEITLSKGEGGWKVVSVENLDEINTDIEEDES